MYSDAWEEFTRNVFLSRVVITTIVIKMMERAKNVSCKQTFKIFNQYYSTKPTSVYISGTMCDVFIVRDEL